MLSRKDGEMTGTESQKALSIRFAAACGYSKRVGPRRTVA